MTSQLGPDYALRADFDAVRAFIRYGTDPGFLVVTATNAPILSMDTPRRRKTNGHLVILETRSGGSQLVAMVSLFNTITYTVLLCPRLSGILRRIGVGHHFDFTHRTVTPLVGLPKTIKVARGNL